MSVSWALSWALQNAAGWPGSAQSRHQTEGGQARLRARGNRSAGAAEATGQGRAAVAIAACEAVIGKTRTDRSGWAHANRNRSFSSRRAEIVKRAR
jgi:hypothetical protein